MPSYRDPVTGKTTNVTQEQYNWLQQDTKYKGYGLQARLQKFKEEQKATQKQAVRKSAFEQAYQEKYGGKEEMGKQDVLFRQAYPGWDSHTQNTREARVEAMGVAYEGYKSNVPQGERVMSRTEFTEAVLTNPEALAKYEAAIPSFRSAAVEKDKTKRKQQLAGILTPIAAVLTVSGVLPPAIGSAITGAAARASGMSEVPSLLLAAGTGAAGSFEAGGGAEPEALASATTTTGGAAPAIPSISGSATPDITKLATGVMSGKITWNDILSNFGQAAIGMVAEAIYQAPENAELKKEYERQRAYAGQDVELAEQMAGIGRERVSQDYARQMDELRRSQHVQNLYKEEELARRGITPESKSTIAESEWRRLSEEQEAARTGADILKERRLQDIGLQLEGTKRSAEREGLSLEKQFEDKYKTWGDIVRSRVTPSAIGGAIGEALGV